MIFRSGYLEVKSSLRLTRWKLLYLIKSASKPGFMHIPISILTKLVSPAHVRNFGVLFDSDFSFTSRVHFICSLKFLFYLSKGPNGESDSASLMRVPSLVMAPNILVTSCLIQCFL